MFLTLYYGLLHTSSISLTCKMIKLPVADKKHYVMGRQLFSTQTLTITILNLSAGFFSPVIIRSKLWMHANYPCIHSCTVYALFIPPSQLTTNIFTSDAVSYYQKHVVNPMTQFFVSVYVCYHYVGQSYVLAIVSCGMKC